MSKRIFSLQDIPKYENIRAQAAKYPELEPSSAAAFVLLLRVASDMLAATDEYLAQHQLSQGRWIVMMLLYRAAGDGPGATTRGTLNPCELASKAGVTRATMTGLLDGLERSGHIERITVEQDRRMFDVSLTPQGKSFLEGVMPGYFRLVRKLMGGLSEDEREHLITLATKLGATAMIAGRGLKEK